MLKLLRKDLINIYGKKKNLITILIILLVIRILASLDTEGVNLMTIDGNNFILANFRNYTIGDYIYLIGFITTIISFEYIDSEKILLRSLAINSSELSISKYILMIVNFIISILIGVIFIYISNKFLPVIDIDILNIIESFKYYILHICIFMPTMVNNNMNGSIGNLFWIFIIAIFFLNIRGIVFNNISGILLIIFSIFIFGLSFIISYELVRENYESY